MRAYIDSKILFFTVAYAGIRLEYRRQEIHTKYVRSNVFRFHKLRDWRIFFNLFRPIHQHKLLCVFSKHLLFN